MNEASVLAVSPSAQRDLTAMLHWWRTQRAANGGGTPIGGSGLVWCKNASASDRARFEVLGIDGPILDATKAGFASGLGISLIACDAETHFDRFAVLAVPIVAGGYGWCWVDGICPAKVDYGDVDFPHAGAQAGATLLAGLAGPARIIGKPASTGSGTLSLVHLGQPYAVTYDATVSTTWSAGASASVAVTLPDGSAVTVTAYEKWLDTGQSIAAGTVRIYFDRVAVKWYADLTKCSLVT